MFKYFLFFLLLITSLAACSSRRNTHFHRSWYALNSRYNIYYNAQQAFTEGIKQIEKHRDTLQANKHLDQAIHKCKKAIEQYSIREKPQRKRGWQQNHKQRALQNRTEYNPFIIHCWLLMGKAFYYRQEYKESLRVFSYINTHFPENRLTHTEVIRWQTKARQKRNLEYSGLSEHSTADETSFLAGRLTASAFWFPLPEDSLFHQTILTYQQEDFITVQRNSSLFYQNYGEHPLYASLLYVEALTYANDSDREKMADTLQKIEKCSSGDSTILQTASQTLARLANGQKLSGEYIPLSSLLTDYSTTRPLPEKHSPFHTFDEPAANEIYYLMIVSPSETIPDHELLFQISSFNFTHLLQIQPDTELHWINKTRIVVIRGFESMHEINLYLGKIKSNTTLSGSISNSPIIPVSASNYNLFHTEKDLTDYIEFYLTEEIM